MSSGGKCDSCYDSDTALTTITSIQIIANVIILDYSHVTPIHPPPNPPSQTCRGECKTGCCQPNTCNKTLVKSQCGQDWTWSG
mgnify:CR=1 FL=1|tara:strand:+ start:786 stop:1034 length:249 start_codon:yes stop_codon:yes gene_type:complete